MVTILNKGNRILAFIMSLLILISPFFEFVYADDTSGSGTTSSSDVLDDFVVLQLRDNDNKTILYDYKTKEGNTTIIQGNPYILYAEIKKSDTNYFQVQVGKKNSDGTLTPNGLSISSPPGNSLSAVGFKNTYFDFVSFTPIEDPKYGADKNGFINKPYPVNDGTLVYKIKNTVKDYFEVTIGLKLLDAAYTGNAENLIDSVTYRLQKSENPSPNDKVQSCSFESLGKNTLSCLFSTTSINIVPDSPISFSIRCMGDTELIYKEMSFTLVHPAKSEITNYGFNTTDYVKYQEIYGIITQEPTVIDNGMAKTKFVIRNGYKKSADLYLMLLINFPSLYFYPYHEGLKITMEDFKITLYDNTIYYPTLKASTISSAIQPEERDDTNLSSSNQEVYNITSDTDEAYLVPLSSVTITNFFSSPTPFEKVLEAKFNTTNTAAEIHTVTIPVAGANIPDITITGITPAGEEKSYHITKSFIYSDKNPLDGTFLSPDTETAYKYSLGREILDYYVLHAKTFGFKTITGYTANLGYIPGSFSSGPWSRWDATLNISKAYGMFTSADEGIEVESSYHLYNKNPEDRNNTNGDLQVKSTTTSTLTNRVGLNANKSAFKMYSIDSNNIENPSATTTNLFFSPGDNFRVVLNVWPYESPAISYTTNGTKDKKDQYLPDKINKIVGTSGIIVDPIIYLILPLGINYKEIKLGFSKKYSQFYGKNTPSAPSNNVKYNIDNVSYLNTTGDGSSIYRITFPKGTIIGRHLDDGAVISLDLDITFTTAKNIASKYYKINDLINITCQSGLNGTVYSGETGTIANIRPDKYNINNGNYLLGVTNGKDEPTVATQGLKEVSVENSISVEKINGKTLNEEWFTYSESSGIHDGNSIALLGKNTEGKIKVNISNRELYKAKNIELILPIPKIGSIIPADFYAESFGFDMDIDLQNTILPTAVNAKYITVNGKNSDGNYNCTDSTKEDSNAILLSIPELDGNSSIDIHLNYNVSDGSGMQINKFRTFHKFENVAGKIEQKFGNYIVAEISSGTISGKVFNDLNKDAELDSSELGIKNINVVVKDNTGRLQTCITNDNGEYDFPVVRKDYTISFINNGKNKQGEYRFNVPMSNLTLSTDGLNAERTYSNITGDTHLNIPMSSYYVVEYDGNGGTGAIPKNQECSLNQTITVHRKPDSLKKIGYAFKEWNTKADGTGHTYLPNSSLIVTDDLFTDISGSNIKTLTLYAIWNPITYKVTLDYQGGTSKDNVSFFEINNVKAYITDEYKKSTGKIMQFMENNTNPTIIKNGYKFEKWDIVPTGKSKPITKSSTLEGINIYEDFTLYAHYKEKDGYTVTYNTGTDATVITQSTGQKWTAYVLKNEADNVRRPGYDFVCWKFDGKEIKKSATYGELAKNDTITSIELEAEWTPKTIFTVNYADTSPSAIQSKTNVSWTSKELYPDINPTKPEHILIGWSLEGDTNKENIVGKTYKDLVNNNDSITSITICPIWKEAESAKRIVKYVSKNGDSISDKVIEKNGVIPLPNITKLGYTFDGWYYNDAKILNTTKFSDLITDESIKEITLEARWNEKTYTVIFLDDNAGNPVETITKKWTDTINISQIPTKDYHTFDRWLFNGEKVTPGTTTVRDLLKTNDSTATINIIASWEPISYTIVFSTIGGSYIATLPNKQYNSKNLIPIEVPTKKGYDFAGWYTSETSQTDATKVTADKTIADLKDKITIVGNNITLYAKWSEKNSFKVKYDTNGGTPITLNDKENVKWTDNNLLPPSSTTITKNGYKFIGWICGAKIVDSNTKYSELAGTNDTTGSHVTFVATWAPETYNITYYKGTEIFNNWGTTTVVNAYTYGKEVALNDGPSTADLRFEGWYTSSDLSVTSLIKNVGTPGQFGDLVLYGKWTPIYTITVKATPGGTVNTSGGNYDVGSNVTIVATVEDPTYKFVGWRKNTDLSYISTVTPFTFTVDGPVTYTAVFEKITYLVTIESTTGGSVDTSSGNFAEGANVTIKATANPTYKFVGWRKNSESTYITTNDTLTFTVSEAVTYTAEFEKITHLVTINTTPGGSVNTSSGNFAEGTSVTIEATANPTYKFVGWKKNSESTYITTNDTLTFTVSEAVTYTAVFEKITYLVTVDTTPGGTVSPSGSNSYEVGSNITIVATVKDPNYKFVGWRKNSESGYVSTDKSFTFNVTETVTYTAEFTLLSTYTITVNSTSGGAISVNPTTGGSITYTGNFKEGTEITLYAHNLDPITYKFVGWKKNSDSTYVTTSDTLTFNVTETATYTAIFSEITYNTYNINVGIEGNGSISGINVGNTTVHHNDSFTLTATADIGWTFAGWYENNKLISTSSTYVLNVEKDHNIVAKFIEDSNSTIHGTIKDKVGNPIKNANVKLVIGKDIFATARTDVSGKYVLKNIPENQYNMAVTIPNALYDATITKICTVNKNIVEFNITTLYNNTSSILELVGAKTPNILVDGLDEEANRQRAIYTDAEDLKLILTVEKTSEVLGNSTDDKIIKRQKEQIAIKELVDNTNYEFYDITVLEKIIAYGATNYSPDIQLYVLEGRIKLIIPFDFSGKENIKVLRYHDYNKHSAEADKAEILTEIKNVAATTPADEFCYFNRKNGTIELYISKFSTYTICYDIAGSNNQPSVPSTTITYPPENQNPIDIPDIGEVFLDEHIAYVYGNHLGLVNPDAALTRAEIAMMIYRLLNNSFKEDIINKYKSTNSTGFIDVLPENWYYEPITFLQNIGIISGYSDGTFRPNGTITREEFASIISKLDVNYTTLADDNIFEDIFDSWAKNDILKLVSRGWINGYPDNKYRPKNNITRAEAISIINRILKRNPSKRSNLLDNMKYWPDNSDVNKWYYIDIQEASTSHHYEIDDKGHEKWITVTVE